MPEVKLDLQRLLDDGVALTVAKLCGNHGFEFKHDPEYSGEDRNGKYIRLRGLYQVFKEGMKKPFTEREYEVLIWDNGMIKHCTAWDNETIKNPFAINELLSPYNILDRIEEGKFGEWLVEEWGFKKIGMTWHESADRSCIIEVRIEGRGQGLRFIEMETKIPFIPTSKAFARQLFESLGIRKEG